MPQRWLHEFFDIMAQGKSGWKIHKEKDEPSKFLGKKHRIIRHNTWVEWQIKVLKNAGLTAPVYLSPSELTLNLKTFPKGEMTFEEATHIMHEYLDEVWSSLALEQKLFWIEAFKYIIENPQEFFHKNILSPEDIELSEFKRLQNFVKSKGVEELV